MIIQLLSGARYEISDYGLIRLFHHIPSPEITHNRVEVQGRGELITGSEIGQRTIEVELGFRVTDIYDFYLLRDELNGLFLREEAFYIIFKREPHKRWKVKIDSQFKIPPKPKLGSFTIAFRTVNKYAESIATTANVKEWDIGLWAWDGTITWDEDFQYRFLNTNTFVINNIGNVMVDPREHELEIVLSGTFGNRLTMRNITTNDVFQFNGSLVPTDALRLNGIRALKNGVSVFGQTNKQVIRLAPGPNTIIIEGGTLNSAAFNFRFLSK